MHWMQRFLSTDGGAVSVEIPNGTSIREVWGLACDAMGEPAEAVAARIAKMFRLELADFDLAEPRAVKLIPETVARRFHIYPLREDDRRIHIATSDPADADAEQQIGFASGRTPVFHVATPDQIGGAIDATYSPTRIVEDLLQNLDAGLEDAVTIVQETEFEALGSQDADAEPVVRLVNLVLRDAVEHDASDVHIEPGRTGGAIRFRIDGVLRQYMQMPMPALVRVISRIKIIGRLDIADRLRPQDGRATIRVRDRSYDLRISTVPSREAEKAVIRILRAEMSRRLRDLGMAPQEFERLRRALAVRDGIIIVTGPTGSGKTTTLYAAIRDLATSEVNVMTVEDPVEYELAGITQIQIEPKRGVTFASALRAILRQDPDIILVGEIRDLETAQTAVQAAMTGHLVLATLHTNDAVSVVQRLQDLGLERASIAGSLRGVLGQRLVRRVCPACASQPVPGCAECGSTGYRGRAPVIEVMLCDDGVRGLIANGATLGELQRTACEAGMRTMLEVAEELARNGITRTDEIERVIGERKEAVAQAVSDAPHILLVDDDAVNRTLARMLLEKAGYRTTQAADGQEALDKIGVNHDYALVLLDLDMPRVGGAQVLQSLRRSMNTAGLPVVILTGNDQDGQEVQLMDAGADDYIRKPIDPARFVARIRATLRRAGL